MKAKAQKIKRLLILCSSFFLVLSLTACSVESGKPKGKVTFKITRPSSRIEGTKFKIDFDSGKIDDRFHVTFSDQSKFGKDIYTQDYKINGNYNQQKKRLTLDITGTEKKDVIWYCGVGPDRQLDKHSTLRSISAHIEAEYEESGSYLKPNEFLGHVTKSEYKIISPTLQKVLSMKNVKLYNGYHTPCVTYDLKLFRGIPFEDHKFEAEPLS